MLIVCPTGTMVYGFKSAIPDFSGAENVGVDATHGVLQYKRPGKDSKVVWAPLSALRRIDAVLCDEEASQYEDVDWQRIVPIYVNSLIFRLAFAWLTSISCSLYPPTGCARPSVNICSRLH